MQAWAARADFWRTNQPPVSFQCRSCIFLAVQMGPPFSGPAFSSPANWSSIFRSCIFSVPATGWPAIIDIYCSAISPFIRRKYRLSNFVIPTSYATCLLYFAQNLPATISSPGLYLVANAQVISFTDTVTRIIIIQEKHLQEA